MKAHLEGGARAAADDIVGEMPPRHPVAYIGTERTLSDCMARALEQEVAELTLDRFADFAELYGAGAAGDYRLILIDAGLNWAIPAQLDRLRQSYPDTVICVLFHDTAGQLACVRAMAANQAVRSFLPMRLRLDTWLAAVRLMLSGGDYMPPDLCMPGLAGAGFGKASVPLAGNRDKPVQANLGMSRGRLTSREIEVLGLVARGFQNKNVAAKLNLSEHTVKLHMHHIISKLGARNRTEAAVIYFDEIAADEQHEH